MEDRKSVHGSYHAGLPGFGAPSPTLKNDMSESDIEKHAVPESQQDTDAAKVHATVTGAGIPDLNELSAEVERSLPQPPTLSAAEVKRLYRKLDVRLMPLYTLMYLCAFLDRGNIGNAKIQGLTSELNLTGNKYNIALAMFFVPCFVVEVPQTLLTKRMRPSRWLPGMTMAWGVTMTLMGLIQTYPQLVGARLVLGVIEGGFFPGVAWHLSMWYPRHKLQLRIGMFWAGATLAGAFSGLLAYGISFMSGTEGKLGWSWIFILEGLITVVVAFCAFFILFDFPTSTNASFLTPEERAYVIWRKKYDNSRVGEDESFALRYVWAAVKDWQTWLHILVYFSIIGPLYGISFFLPTIINDFGFPPAVSQLLTVPPYVVATIVTVIFAVLSDRFKYRSPFILAGHAMCILGFGIQVSNAPFGVKYFGTFFCVAGSYSAFPGVITWLSNNTAGQYKRGAATAVQIGIGNFAGAIASVLYRSQDAPRYILGDALELMFIGIGLPGLVSLVLIYSRINARRDDQTKEHVEKAVALSLEERRAMGDRAPDFRYTL